MTSISILFEVAMETKSSCLFVLISIFNKIGTQQGLVPTGQGSVSLNTRARYSAI